MTVPPNTSQEIDAAIKAELSKHEPDMRNAVAAHAGMVMPTSCLRCGDIWPCQYVIQASITLKLTAIATFLSIQGVSNGETTRQGQRR